MLESLIPSRSVEDYVDGLVPIQLAGTVYRLRELPMIETDAWASSIDGRLMGLLARIDNLDNGEQTLADLFEDARLFDATLLDTLLAYDRDHVLPSKDVLHVTVTHTQILFALLGVWATTKSPLAAGVVNAVKMALILTGNEPAPTPSSPESSTGASATSVDDSPTDSSTTTSPRQRNGSPTSSGLASSSPSKPPASGTSPRTTRRRTASGSGPSPRATAALSASPGRRSSRP